MARTKQKARKVTGGRAHRIPLKTLHKKKGKATYSSQKPVLEQAQPNFFCVMCRDGGDLWLCDELGCNRVVCHKCLIVPKESVEMVKQAGVTFKCMTCHWKEARNSRPQPYFPYYEGILLPRDTYPLQPSHHHRKLSPCHWLSGGSSFYHTGASPPGGS
ncbi:hypothetical protein EDD16DRAFT_1518335 [Pisolithus croceorrhizus]|nr:hypothetical protein EDD16DRAFT_1518335 [Pisolithus croceorrhizus]